MITENIIVSKEFTWIDIEGPHRPDYEFIEEEFCLPPLLVQDCMRPEQLPKFEKTQRNFFFMVRIYDPASHGNDITIQRLTNKVAIFISENRVVTIHSERIFPLAKFAEMKDREGFPQDVKRLTHQIFRIAIMAYEDLLFDLQERYEKVEQEVLSKETEGLSNTMVYEFRRKIFVIKGILQLTQHSLNNSRDFWGDSSSLQQDIKENIDQLYFRLDALSHNFDQLFALYLSMNEQRSNEVMKVLTVFASLMLPLTFISSFYGMNFDQLPGVHTTPGFVGVIVIMVTTTFVTIWFFNKRRWFKQINAIR